MPNRILKDSICTDETVGGLSANAEVLYYRLLVQCDNYGRITADTEAIRRACYPSQLKRVSAQDIAEWVGELLLAHLLTRCNAGGTPHVRLTQSGLFQNESKRPTAEVWLSLRATVFERDDYTCQYCGKRGGNLHCDHVIPVSRGGGNELSNLATACAACNMAKHNKTPGEWKQ